MNKRIILSGVVAVFICSNMFCSYESPSPKEDKRVMVVLLAKYNNGLMTTTEAFEMLQNCNLLYCIADDQENSLLRAAVQKKDMEFKDGILQKLKAWVESDEQDMSELQQEIERIFAKSSSTSSSDSEDNIA